MGATMRDFVAKMQQAKDIAAARRQKLGVGGGGKVYSWAPQHAPTSEQTEPDFSDRMDDFLARARQRMADAKADFAAAMLRIREIDLGGVYSDEIPF